MQSFSVGYLGQLIDLSDDNVLKHRSSSVNVFDMRRIRPIDIDGIEENDISVLKDYEPTLNRLEHLDEAIEEEKENIADDHRYLLIKV